MKTMLDWLPALAFVAAYLVYDIYVATAVLIAALFLSVAVHRARTGEWHKMNTIAALVALVLGGTTLWVHDPMFIKLKPTVVYAVFAAGLAGSHFIGEKPLMARIPPTMIDLPEWLWARINAAWAVFFLLCAIVNVPIALYLPEATWVMIKTFGFTGASFLFLLGHLPFVAPYLPKEEPSA
ncbi:inner membrane-spanning protein YciB [uncultured Abyssibacter sp.]|uniref:inner membrane-spanning protein YciB n=1 Tax=uncultured Abyssibacter sp. TaxID=2320202 RepID=UPI0032B25B4F